MDDLRIDASALRQQAAIARAAGRADAGAELRARRRPRRRAAGRHHARLRPAASRPRPSREELELAAADLRETYGADTVAAFVEEAAEVYERRGLFGYRY